MKKTILFILILTLALPNLSFSAEFIGGENISVDEARLDDIYAAGGNVQVNQVVEGDLLIMGGQANVEADILEDLNILSGNVWVNGNVGDDLRIGGGDVKINGSVSDDIIIGSGNLSLSKEVIVGGDMYFASGQVNLSGSILGDVKGTAGNLYIDALIEGDLELIGFESLSFGPNARILGNFNYQNNEELENLPVDLVAGEIVYKKSEFKTPEDSETFWRQVKLMLSFYGLLTTLFFGLFLIWIYRYYSYKISETVFNHPLKSLGLGFAVAFLLPVVSFLLTITAIGIPMSLVILALWFVFLYLGIINSAIIIGNKLIKINEKSGFLRIYVGFALGCLIIFILGLVPILGFIIKFIFALIGLGGLTLYQHELTLQLRKKKLV